MTIAALAPYSRGKSVKSITVVSFAKKSKRGKSNHLYIMDNWLETKNKCYPGQKLSDDLRKGLIPF
ncbi:unnamed protein product [Acanthoscelides obtectus]|uniref:Uncharacterized protein n=1 Tax=Acanthoscelides obtectus TaxID=200917 RepID=A0A9P0KTE0_ACAOB|nr:unnamed protein product [Acanthoscelides obtectus]CAK1674551.1 hypothetical protein AOBTE_LOCUS29655 [Acanthoscelides obtectus]